MSEGAPGPLPRNLYARPVVKRSWQVCWPGQWGTQLDAGSFTVSNFYGVDPEAFTKRIAQSYNAHDALVTALHEISLCSQNSASSKEECGRIARAALKSTGSAP